MRIYNVLIGALVVLAGALLFAPGQVAAQAQSASAAAMLEEIVVTARRREENLLDLPLSIAAITAEAMEAQGISSIEQIGELVPNVSLDTGSRRHNTSVIIRGIGGGNADPVQVFGSGMYIDGHYIPNSLGGYMSTMDIERVEVLRGPQGTLFGKNATGGLVNIVTAKPGPEFESSLTLRLAEDGQQDVRGMINFPISDNVFGRVSVAHETFDGYYFNRNYGVDEGATEFTSINAALRFAVGDHWTIDTSLNYQRNRDDNAPAQCAELDGNVIAGGLANFLYPGGYQDQLDDCNATAALGPFMMSSDKDSFVDLDVESAFVTARWNSDGAVGGLDDLAVKLSGSYRKTDYDYLSDFDAGFLAIFDAGTVGAVGQDTTTRGFEVLVEARANDRLNFTAGVNYFYELSVEGDGGCREQFLSSPISEIIPGSDPPAPVNGMPTVGFDCVNPNGLQIQFLPYPRANPFGPQPRLLMARVENESIGVFGHVTYVLNDNWTLDIGARWTEDDRDYWNMEVIELGCNVSVDQSLRALGNAAATADPGLCPGFTVPLNFTNVITNAFFNTADGSWSEVTPMLSLTRNLAAGDRLDSGMVYFLYSEGFLTGGFNAEINTNLPLIAPLVSFEPEHVKNYEVGFKGTFAGGRLQLMADIFYMDYTDKQEEIDIDNPNFDFGPQDPARAIQNVSEVDIYGIELELRASPWDGGFVSVDIGTLSNEYGEFITLDGVTGLFVDQSDTVLLDLTPDWTVNIGLEHAFGLANGATFTPRINIVAQDDYDYVAAADGLPSPCTQDSYSKVNLRFTYRPASANWRATLFGNNVTDELIYEACRNFPGVYNYRYERPAYWGMEFTADWGQ